MFVDDAISSGIHEGVAENPQFKIVGSVHGDWDQAKAQARAGRLMPDSAKAEMHRKMAEPGSAKEKTPKK